MGDRSTIGRMSVKINPPWPGRTIGANWAWHLAHGSAGGDDYVVPANTPIIAIAAGTIELVADAFNTIVIRLPDGRGIVHEENKTRAVANGQHVEIGAVLGTTGLVRGGITRWPHMHGVIGGGRHPINEPAAGPTWVNAGVDANTRTMVANGSHVRFGPDTHAAVYATLKAGDTVEAVEFTSAGEVVNGTAVWYGLEYGWVSAGIVKEGVVTTGLPDIAPAPPVVTPPVVVAPPVTVTAPVVAPPVVTPPVTPTVPVTVTPSKPVIVGKVPGMTSPAAAHGGTPVIPEPWYIALLRAIFPPKK